MAPFGKRFLKARLKNRSKVVEETPGKEIQVQVCQEEKVVCGVTKHTTCADVVKALLEDHQTVPEGKKLLHGEPKEFCILEQWRGFERALPPLTRILRLWNAWGDERPFIRFVLVKTSEFVPSSKGAKRASRSRGARSKRLGQGPVQYAKTVSVEKQKRMVKRAFRKLEKIQKGETSEGSEDISKWVQLIISQDQTIRQQIHQMRELESEIKHLEQQLSSPTPHSSLTECEDGQASPLLEFDSRMQECFCTTDGIKQLDLHLLRHKELIDQLSQDIELELRTSAWTADSQGLKEAAAAGSESDLSLSSLDLLELESLRSELESSMSAGLSLHSQSQEIEKELQQNKTDLQARNQEYQHLVAQLRALELGACLDQPGPACVKSQIRAPDSQQTADKVRQTCSPTDATDTDSDTGISSTHSQDSLTPCADRSPLDTDI